MVEFAVAPERMALLNIDLQNCFVAGSGADGLAVLARVNRLSEVCREAKIPVFHVRHALADATQAGVLGEIFPAVLDGFLDRGSETAAFHDGLVRDHRDILMDKPHFGAFHDTALETELRSRGVDTIVISGIETNVCCETTAREAMVRNFRVFFLSDGTTTGGVPGLARDEVQRASLATLGMCFAEVVTVNEMAERIQAAAAG